MTVQLLEIPDDTHALPLWLERQLLGTDLAALVAQLEAMHGAAADNGPTLDQVLGDQRQHVLREGLAGLSPAQIRQLLVNPHVLLVLQEALLLEGGPYWLSQSSSAPQMQQHLVSGRRRMERFLAVEATPSSADERLSSTTAAPVSPRQTSWKWRDALIVLATAAVVFVAVSLYRHNTQGPGGEVATVGWGWAKPGALSENATRQEYLNHLAKEAGEWFNKKPENPPALAQRIAQFRLGCSMLILSPHPALPPEDRTWLVAKCKAWAAKLDEQVVALENGADVNTVRGETDGIVRKLMDALTARANASEAAA